jgi:hypothetical protein
MKKKLLALNLVLVALTVLAWWRFREHQRAWSEREAKVLRTAPKAAPAASIPPQPAPQPVKAASYMDVAQRLLFAPDRNPNVVIEVAPPKPLPPLPVLHGVANFGDGVLVILSEKPGAPHKSYTAGEKVGEFTLVAVNRDEIVLDFEGRKITRKFSELIDRNEPPAAAAALSPAVAPSTVGAAAPEEPKPQAAPAPSTVSNASSSGPGVTLFGQVRACVPGDTTPPGTVVNGLRKVMTETPFGKVCRWEPAQ